MLYYIRDDNNNLMGSKQIIQSIILHPDWGRFINVDSIIGTKEDHIGYNLYSYCENNPINKMDSEGNFAIAISVVAAIGILALATLAVATVYPKSMAPVAQALDTMHIRKKEKEKEWSKEIEKVIPTTPTTYIKKDVTIYRWGNDSSKNLTPRKIDTDGLSFTTNAPQKKSIMTTINTVNSTKILYAIEDHPGHVAVKPVGASMQEWINQGEASLWTQALKKIVIKWDPSDWRN